ncbi:hypothetical protein M427DRAFT_130142 [Gonapodya prolifera JEL478]|uniref:Uncharacterized protein n=1 Tax=Gonapodya prolifera (strain JEL478) TaxID=1344416 RepID=A0A139B0Y7_GONPJ|nr:hypothetical protein M427DRAFT_130142 [Gonapodya prolifera JEL478]|eukprot:KXS22463.1 hypothetical protein M427DRAFT_130142 [Gonapodya prolifera JEL478]
MSNKFMFSFPLLKNPEILRCMADLQLPCSEDDLKNPTPAGVQRIYEQLLTYLLGAAAKDYFAFTAQPAFQVLQHLDNPELHSEAVQALGFYKQLSKLLIRVGLDRFALKDLQRPEPQQLRRAISALINFAKFREERLGMYEAMTAKTEDLEDQRKLTQQRYQALEARVNTLRLLRAEQEPQIATARADNIRLHAELSEQQKRKQTLTQNVKDIQATRTKEAEKHAELDQRILGAKQDVARLKSRVVENPEGLRQTIAEMTNSLAGEKLAVAEKERKLREFRARTEVLTRFEQDLDRLQPAVSELELQLKRLNTAMRGPTEAREALDRAQGDLRDLDAKGQHLLRQVQTSQDKLTRLTQLASQKRRVATERSKRMKEELDTLRKERHDKEKMATEERKEGDEWSKKIELLREQHNADVASLETEYARLKAQLESYAREVVQECGGVEGRLR